MNANKLLALMLALCLALSLCACGSENTETTTEAPTTEATTAATETAAVVEEDDGTVTYTISVVDEGGNPISGAMVQLCLESCMPGVTNENGVAEFKTTEADYHVTLMTMPEGYDYTTEETEFYFEDGSYELTITLKAVA